MKIAPYVALALLVVFGVWQYKALRNLTPPPPEKHHAINPQEALKNSFIKISSEIDLKKLDDAAENPVVKEPQSDVIASRTLVTQQAVRTDESLGERENNVLSHENTNVNTDVDISTLYEVETLDNTTTSETTKQEFNRISELMATEGANDEWRDEVREKLENTNQFPLLKDLEAKNIDCRETVCAINFEINDYEKRLFQIIQTGNELNFEGNEVSIQFADQANEVVVYLTNSN